MGFIEFVTFKPHLDISNGIVKAGQLGKSCPFFVPF